MSVWLIVLLCVVVPPLLGLGFAQLTWGAIDRWAERRGR